MNNDSVKAVRELVDLAIQRRPNDFKDQLENFLVSIGVLCRNCGSEKCSCVQ